MSHFDQSFRFILIFRMVLAALIIGAVLIVITLRDHVFPESPAETPPRAMTAEVKDRLEDEELRELIEAAWDEGMVELEDELLGAWRELESSLLLVFGRMEDEVRDVGERFAEEDLTRRNLARLSGKMALDRTRGGSRTDDWLQERLWAEINGPAETYYLEAGHAISEFDRAVEVALAEFDQRMAGQIRQEWPESGDDPRLGSLLAKLEEEVRSDGRKTGILVGLGVGLAPFDVEVIRRNWTYFQRLAREIRAVIGRVFSPIVTRLSARLAASGSSVWFPPVAVVLTVGGTIWTGYDIYTMGDRVRTEFLEQVDSSLGDQRVDLRENILDPNLKEVKGVLEEVQAERSKAVDGLLKWAGENEKNKKERKNQRCDTLI